MDKKKKEEKVALCYFLKKYIVTLDNISKAIRDSKTNQDEWDNFQTITVEIDRFLSEDSLINNRLYHNEINSLRDAQNRLVKHVKGKIKNKSEEADYFKELSVSAENLIRKLSM